MIVVRGGGCREAAGRVAQVRGFREVGAGQAL